MFISRRRRSGLFQVTDADANTWLDAVDANTTEYNALRRSVQNLIIRLKGSDNSLWDSIYSYWICVKDETASSLDLKSLSQRDFFGSPSFNSTLTGMEYDGGTQYAQTNFKATDVGADDSFFMYTRCKAIEAETPGALQGAANSASNKFANLVFRSNGTSSSNIPSNLGGGEHPRLSTSVASSKGKSFYFNRENAASLTFYKDGEQLSQNLASDAGHVTPGLHIYHMAINDDGASAQFLAGIERSQICGGGLTSDKTDLVYQADLSFWVSLGITD